MADVVLNGQGATSRQIIKDKVEGNTEGDISEPGTWGDERRSQRYVFDGHESRMIIKVDHQG